MAPSLQLLGISKRLVPRHLFPCNVFERIRLSWESKDAFSNNVALNLVCSTSDAGSRCCEAEVGPLLAGTAFGFPCLSGRSKKLHRDIAYGPREKSSVKFCDGSLRPRYLAGTDCIANPFANEDLDAFSDPEIR
jgi:hypothetical protein